MLSGKRVYGAIAIATISLSLSSVALALAALPVSDPSRIPFSSTYPIPARLQVGAALRPVGGKFIDGIWCNGTATLHYGGDAASLNKMAELLAECPGVTIDVSFLKLDKQCDWKLIHKNHGNAFHLIVNLKSEQIRLEDLKIPSVKGPKLVP